MNIRKFSIGLASIATFGCGYYYHKKNSVLIEILIGKGNQIYYGDCYGIYPEIPFYLENNKDIVKAMDEYKDYLIRDIKNDSRKLEKINEKFKKDVDFVEKLVKETNNVFYMMFVRESWKGKEFNNLLPNPELRKYIGEDMKDGKHEYKLGINEQTKELGEIRSIYDGFTFSNENNIDEYGIGKENDYLYKIEIPDDAKVSIISKNGAISTKINLIKCLEIKKEKKRKKLKFNYIVNNNIKLLK